MRAGNLYTMSRSSLRRFGSLLGEISQSSVRAPLESLMLMADVSHLMASGKLSTLFLSYRYDFSRPLSMTMVISDVSFSGANMVVDDF